MSVWDGGRTKPATQYRSIVLRHPTGQRQTIEPTLRDGPVLQNNNIRIGVDVGGTFTDVVGLDDLGGSYFTKVPSTPENQSIGVVAGIAKLLHEMAAAPTDVLQVAHGTTVATNALLERAGACTGL